MAEKTEKTKVIELMDGYVCIADPNSYSLARKKTRKTGAVDYEHIAYYASLQSVLRRMASCLAYDSLKGTQTLSEAMTAIRDSNERVAKKIDEIFLKVGGRYGL